MKETEVTAKIVKGLNGVHGCWAQKRHSGKFGSGDPDVSGVYNGTAFFIETKVQGGELTKLQADKLEKWRQAGAKTFLAAYLPGTKKLKMIYLDDEEKWDMFTGREKLDELINTTASASQPLSNYSFSGLLEVM